MTTEGLNLPEPNKPNGGEIGKIKVEDLLAAEKLPEADGTLIVLQVNSRDIRDPESAEFGTLKPEAAQLARETASSFFREAFDGMSPEELGQVDILVFASNVRLTTPSGLESSLQRAVLSGDETLTAIRSEMESHGVPYNQLINNISSVGGGPFEVSELVDLQILTSDEGYLQYLKEKYMPQEEVTDLSLNSGTGLSPVSEEQLWVAYENDQGEDRDKRIELGAEGPEEIAQRVNAFVSKVEQFAQQHHNMNPGRRVIVWAIGHYDNISPYLKKFVLDKPMDTYLGVDKTAGVSINVHKDGKATSKIKGREFEVTGLS